MRARQRREEEGHRCWWRRRPSAGDSLVRGASERARTDAKTRRRACRVAVWPTRAHSPRSLVDASPSRRSPTPRRALTALSPPVQSYLLLVFGRGALVVGALPAALRSLVARFLANQTPPRHLILMTLTAYSDAFGNPDDFCSFDAPKSARIDPEPGSR